MQTGAHACSATVVAFVNAQTWFESREVLRAHEADLVAAEADAVFTELLEGNARNDRAVRLLSHRRALLARAREAGIDAAYADVITPQYVESLREELRTLAYGEPRRVDVARGLLLGAGDDPAERARLQFELGRSLIYQRDDDVEARLSEGIDLLTAASVVLSRESAPGIWAEIRSTLAVAELRRRSGDREVHLERAIGYGEEAASVLRGGSDGAALAAALNVLGSAYLERTRDQAASLAQAAACFHEALAAIPAGDQTRQRGVLELTLADALSRAAGALDRPGDDAIAHYEASLGYWSGADATFARSIEQRITRLRIARSMTATDLEARLDDLIRAAALTRRDDNPEEWARLEHNLGETYRVRTEDDTSTNIERAIEHLTRALEVFTAADHPRDFGLAANSLGAAYLERRRGDRSENIERAIALLDDALRVRPRDQYPDFWAKTQVNLGGAFMLRVAGNSAENASRAVAHLRPVLEEPVRPAVAAQRTLLERQLAKACLDSATDENRGEALANAIAHAESALRFADSETDRDDIAQSHWIIGHALRARQGQTPDDVERAIDHFERGLAVRASTGPSLDRPQAEQALAGLYEFRDTGDRADNLRRAWRHYEAALHEYERGDVALGVAMCHGWLAAVARKQSDRPQRERLSAALEHLGAAIATFPESGSPLLRADLHLDAGDVLSDLAAGDRGDRVADAVDHYRQALALLTRDDTARWSRAHSALGIALLEWRGGDRAANLEEAIPHQRAVLDVETRETDARSWALAHHNLGNVYAERTLGDRAQNLEEAIAHFTAALEVFTREGAPDEWAMVQNSLGGAYLFRARGERAQNLEDAIGHYERALQVYTRAAFPNDWAMTLHNLANAYLQRIEGYVPDNVERAIRLHEQSLEFRTREALPFFWAMTHVNLGTAYRQRDYGVRADNLRAAVSHFRLALEVYTKAASPTNWAWVQLTLGSLPASSGVSHTERVDALNAALEAYQREAFPERWAAAHHNLALVERERSDQGPAVSASVVEHLQLALQVLTPEAFPRECRNARMNLADEYLRGHDWSTALEWYTRAIEVAESIFGAAYTEPGRLEESSTTNRLHTHAAYCLLRLGRAEESLLQFDTGRARLLAQNLTRGNADLQRLPADLRERLTKARAAVRDLETEMRIRDEDVPTVPSTAMQQLSTLFPHAPRVDGPGYSLHTLTIREARMALGAQGLRLRFADQLRDARASLNALEREAAAIDPQFTHHGIDAADIASVIPEGGALVAFILTPAGSAAWVVPSGAAHVESDHAVPLADEALERVDAMLAGSGGDGGWLRAFFDAREQTDIAAWQETIDTTTRDLWEVLVGPVQARLEAVSKGRATSIVLLPQGRLALLPLHGAWREDGGARRAFLDDHAVTYAPSLYARLTSQQRLAEAARQQGGLVAVVNPTDDLPYAEIEGGAAASHFDAGAVQVLARADATEPAVVAAVRRARYLHFATHGLYDWRDAMRSYLALAGNSMLTMAEVLSAEVDLSASRLVVLSACETGFTDFQKAPDEFLGLPAAFIEGGAPAVVSALWAINDLSTALLFEEFYRRHLEGGEDIAGALRGAQLWLRDATADELRLADRWEAVYRQGGASEPYAYRTMRYWRAHSREVPYAAPYYWAAFTCYGA